MWKLQLAYYIVVAFQVLNSHSEVIFWKFDSVSNIHALYNCFRLDIQILAKDFVLLQIKVMNSNK